MEQPQYVLDCLRDGDYRITLHAKQRMAERNVSYADIRSCSETGTITLGPDGKIKIVGSDIEGEELTLICAEEDSVLIITVF